MSYAVFWLQRPSGDDLDPPISTCGFRVFDDHEMLEALSFANSKRKEAGASHVTMSSSDPNQVGEMGVDNVINGFLPDGTPYDWRKRRL